MGKILTVVGRAKDGTEFLEGFSEFLPDNYQLIMIHNLGEFSEVDGKERFLAFVEQEKIEGKPSTVEQLSQFLRGKQFGTQIHNTIEESADYAKEFYGLEDEVAEQQKKWEELREEFPPFSAAEIKQFITFQALVANGNVTPLRCKFNGELATVLVTIINGHDEIQVTPLGILLSDDMADDMLTMPFEEEKE